MRQSMRSHESWLLWGLQNKHHLNSVYKGLIEPTRAPELTSSTFFQEEGHCRSFPQYFTAVLT